ncbi:MAG: AAA family ATPase [Planctomycetota bacterium]|jgi:SpoVK/Ycf46/Vps4 family AAA+-type ATPase
MTDPSLLQGLKQALEIDPKNGALWLHYADLARQAGVDEEGLRALRTAAELPDVRAAAVAKLVPWLRERGELAEALLRAEAQLERAEDPALRAELGRIEAERKGAAPPVEPSPEPVAEQPRPQPEAPAKEASGERLGLDPDRLEDDRSRSVEGSSTFDDPEVADDWADHFDWGDLRVTLKDVHGLESVKRQINLRILAPYQQPEIYEAYGREGGGGLLMYGPPGCGKTFMARAVAGELGARFVSVGLHDVLDQYHGQTEKLIHQLFEDARRQSPTVLFFDEFDALGGGRGRGESQFWKVQVDQLLQEMDGVQGKNRDVLVFAATNAPWSVDAAFRRPGRFDRVLFVPPPDRQAREALLRKEFDKLPGGERLDARAVAKQTELFTGADLVELVRRTAERGIDRSLDSGSVSQVTNADLKAALAESKSSASEWLADARNYARYANEGGQYDDLTDFLKSAKKW